jgi:hypothetical protein
VRRRDADRLDGNLPGVGPGRRRGLVAEDPHEHQVSETVAAFRNAAAARAFVGTIIEQWRACDERPVTQSAEGVTVLSVRTSRRRPEE